MKKTSDAESLTIEKIKILLQNSEISEATSLIKMELKKDQNSIAWNKLQEELNYKTEDLKRKGYYYFTYSSDNNTKAEPEVKENTNKPE